VTDLTETIEAFKVTRMVNKAVTYSTRIKTKDQHDPAKLFIFEVRSTRDENRKGAFRGKEWTKEAPAGGRSVQI